MHYYKRNIGDYNKKAGRLTMLQHGAYTLLLDACYDRERFPTLDEAIDWTWASSEEEIAAVKFVIHKFFTEAGEIWRQSRIQEEIDAFQNNAKINKKIALEREEKRRQQPRSVPKKARTVLKDERSVDDPPPDVNEPPRSTHEPPPNHKPLTINHKPEREDASPRGSRLLQDFEMPSDWAEFCKTERPDLNPRQTFSRFKDHWIAKPGKDGRKSDWTATWRNWVRGERSLPQSQQNARQFGNQIVADVSDPDSRASIEAEGVATGIGKWDEREHWADYKARVRGRPVAPMTLEQLAQMAKRRKA